MSIKEINMLYNFRFYIVNFVTSVMIIIIIVFWRKQSIKEIAIFMLVEYIIIFILFVLLLLLSLFRAGTSIAEIAVFESPDLY